MKLPAVLYVVALVLALLLSSYLIVTQELPDKSNTWFSTSGACILCHSTSDFALRDSQGNDVSPVARWRSTMLANSAKDPFWKAKVKHEGIVNPAHKEALENVCTRCHAPMGMVNAFLTSSDYYTLDDLVEDELGKDGVSCTVCHQINDFSSPLFSGNFGINDTKEIYGPYQSPLTAQMVANTGFTPVYSEKINDSRLCGSCHSLFTNSVDEHGEPTGETFVEQALYHEWENSIYGEQNISCQSCHFPQLNEPIKISSRPGFSPGREPFGIHDLTGGNVFMLNLLKENHEELQLHSGEEFLAETINRTKKLLTESTVDLSISEYYHQNDSVFVQVLLKNKAGHKFPTGFPSRRAYLECLLIQDSDTLFHSGKQGTTALVNGDDDHFEPHYEIINNENQVQIYEFVMGDTQGKVTTVLEKAYVPLKDNRIVPEGFSSSHLNYDTVKVVGKATIDSDYFSGLGMESIIYAFPISKVGNAADVKFLLHYETAPESWMHELFEHAETDEDIHRFKNMYYNTNRSPMLIASDSMQLTATSTPEIQKEKYRIYPNPTSGKIHIEGIADNCTYSVFNTLGLLVKKGFIERNESGIALNLPSGNYLLVLHLADGKQFSHSIILSN
ncbi:T9SS type A sorting domain-containing protein [Mariniphaga sp.]|uniref:T9SS type A sorting domain-containing protein n=1 Tax=Mariniphaga sp. TaxID=1954475 RepID=UPI00356AFBC0